MFPYFTVFGRPVFLYPLLGVLGIAAGTLAAACRGREDGVSAFHWVSLALYGTLGAMAGAKALFLISQIGNIAADLRARPLLVVSQTYMMAGFVFYGGLFGGWLGIRLYCRYMRLPADRVLLHGVTVLPLIHAFGRVGCFLAGCCYGVPWTPPLGIAFRSSLSAPNHQHLLPVQLFEAVLLVFIFEILWYYTKVPRKTGQVIALYLLLYAPGRFALEFFRGDAGRGFLLGFSTSQWVSLLCLAAVFGYQMRQRARTP